MPCIIDPVTGFELGDPHLIPLNGEGMPLPPKSAIDTALSNMILSASGWRTVFAASGNEQDDSPAVRDEHLVLAALMADTFSDYTYSLQQLLKLWHTADRHRDLCIFLQVIIRLDITE